MMEFHCHARSFEDRFCSDLNTCDSTLPNTDSLTHHFALLEIANVHYCCWMDVVCSDDDVGVAVEGADVVDVVAVEIVVVVEVVEVDDAEEQYYYIVSAADLVGNVDYC